MKRAIFALLLTALVGSSSGCLSMANMYVLKTGPSVEQPAGRDVAIEIVKVNAFSHSADEVRLVAVYADGAEVSATLRAHRLGVRSGAAGVRYAPGIGPPPPVHRPRPDKPHIPIQLGPVWEDGVSLTDGDVVRWIKSGKVISSFSLRRSNRISEPDRRPSGAAKGFHLGFHLVLIPIAAAVDLVTLPFQLLSLPFLRL
jgi:hypothetical protein